MKRMIAVFLRDLKVGTRDYLILYIMLAPLLFALGLRFFIPSVNQAANSFVVDDSIPPAMVEYLEQYGRVEHYPDLAQLERRVEGIDDVIGLTCQDQEQYLLILEGNEHPETEYFVQALLDYWEQPTAKQIAYATTDLAKTMSPIASIGSAAVIVTAIILGGMVMGLNIIEEKELRTLKALKPTPLKTLEYITGKSLIAVIMPLLQTPLILWLIGIKSIEWQMMLSILLASSSIAILMGLIIGGLSSNQLAGIANSKGIFFVVSASIIGAILLSPSWQRFLYWSPFYWSFITIQDIILGVATWVTVGYAVLWIIGLTLVFILMSRKRILQDI